MGIAGARAAERSAPLACAGEVSPREAWERLKSDAKAALVDVRTPPEWVFAGEADLSSIGRQAHKISWKLYPAYTLNEQFAAQVKAAGITPDAPVFFLCRTGGRSLDAAIAMTAQGYTQCYNITDGFEGPPDEQRRRGMVAGWKASGLPWRQE